MSTSLTGQPFQLRLSVALFNLSFSIEKTVSTPRKAASSFSANERLMSVIGGRSQRTAWLDSSSI